jgi:5-methylcytosine-specific restriction protein A
MVLRPCLDCGTPSARTRCSDCQSMRERTRPSRRVLGRYDTKYLRLRKVAIRAQPWCSRCHTPGTEANPLTADHRVPLGLGGKNVMSNIDVLCRACNSAKRDRLTVAT